MQFQSSSFNTNARMYLYDTPRGTMAKDPMLQSLFSTSTWKALGLMPNTSNLYFHVFQSFTLNTNLNSHVLQVSLLNTTLITHVLQSSSLNTNISSIMCFRVYAQHKQSYMYHQQLAYAQYAKQIMMFICSGVFDPMYQNKTSR